MKKVHKQTDRQTDKRKKSDTGKKSDETDKQTDKEAEGHTERITLSNRKIPGNIKSVSSGQQLTLFRLQFGVCLGPSGSSGEQ